MNKLTLSLGSFVAGAVLMLLLSGIHTSMIVQPSSVFASEAFNFGDFTPKVPGLGPLMSENTAVGVDQTLDGLNCAKCTFSHVTFKYSGGAYSIPAFTFDHVGFTLTGAAANTVRLLMLVQAINSPPAKPVPPKGPIEISAPMNAPSQTIELISLSGTK